MTSPNNPASPSPDAPRPARPTPNGKRHKSAAASPSYAAGLDVGYAYVKWIAQDGTRHILPTAVAPVDLDTGPRGAPRHGDHVVSLDDTPFLVGQSAIWSGRRLTDHLRWDTWWHSIPYRAVLTALARQVPPGAVVVTGIPLSLPLTAGISAPIEHLLKDTLKAHQVLVTQQGAAAALALNLLNEEGQFALIDVGGRTSEFVTILHGHIQAARCAGIRAGVCELYETLAAECRANWHWETDGYVIEQVLRGAMPVPRLGRDGTMVLREIKDRLRLLATPLAERLVAKCRDLWHDGQWLDRVILCGGGADLFIQDLQRWRADIVLAEDRQWLNARGYLSVAADVIGAPEPCPAVVVRDPA